MYLSAVFLRVCMLIFLALLTSCARFDNNIVTSKASESIIDYGVDDLAYLTQLGLMRGHLYVGYELYKAGHIEHAKTHMKHPESELYEQVADAFVQRQSGGFAHELSALSAAVESEQEIGSVNRAYRLLVTAINTNEAAAGSQGVGKKLQLISELLKVAGEEYAIAVVDGKMQNAHEYQDALGFTNVAAQILATIDGGESQAGQESGDSWSQLVFNSKQAAQAQLSELGSLWPTLIPPATLATSADSLFDAANNIQTLAERLN